MTMTDVVTASAEVGGTRSRLAKVDTLAALLRRAAPDEIAPLVGFLTGSPVQGRVGAGWRTLVALDRPPAAAPSLTVGAVDQALTALAETSGKGSTATRRALLDDLFGAATTAEQRFLIALLTGELRQGALEGVMLDAVAKAAEAPVPAVRRAFMLSGRLPATAAIALTGGDLSAIGLQLHRPVRPMLAAPGSSLADALTQLTPCAIEYKLDGARIQVHKTPDRVTIYTRTLREITDSVPELVSLVRALPCSTVVLDGETLALSDDGRPRPFQETMSRFGSTVEEQVKALLLRPYFFDCLHLDGKDLIDLPLRDRAAALRRAVGEHVIPGLVDPSVEDAEELAARALAEGHEGVMVKDLTSVYAAGRRGKAWQKVKPVHTLDLVVLGAEWGHGRRTGSLSNLHLGARDPDGGPPVMVGKTFKGLTDELLRWQTEEFPRYRSGGDDWTVYMRPELVVEIAIDGVQVSTRYPGGVALRFARVVRYRPDKTAAEADTIDTVRGLLA
ncbi:ATP-dependent DNA ligase [Actinokineospora diospyrosa]|uniref:ATP-dependent DNA ligase n=1 Tax=Actinokineospora diospyrosa TaxID=103728 RepID=UPI0020A5BB3D|nr:ATP-dependent DNA ligase [Actinokineospora diospyrosa]